MYWRSLAQMSVAAVVGAAIFEAGRWTGLSEQVANESGEMPFETAQIAEPTAKPAPPVQSRGKKTTRQSAAKPPVPNFQRKKYADLPLAPVDQETIAATEKIVADEDLSAALALASKAGKASRPEVRMAVVNMLAWFGKKTIAELTPFLADADDGVAMEAAAHWKRICSNECTDNERLRMAETVLTKLTSATMLDELGVESIFNEIEDEGAAVTMLIDVIKTGTPAGVEVAKSAYDVVTGESWKDEATARQWIKTNQDL